MNGVFTLSLLFLCLAGAVWGGMPVTLNNGQIEIVIRPEEGGKIVSLKLLDSANGREFLSRSGKPYADRVYGMPFNDTEVDGFDECFPTVGHCHYPEGPWQGTALPDHGELFSVAWQVEQTSSSITCRTGGVRLPYTFSRTASLEATTLRLDYTVTNTSSQPMVFLYAMHPLMAASPESHIVLPQGATVTIGCSSADYAGSEGSVCAWPYTATHEDLSLVPKLASQKCYKVFVSPLEKNEAELLHPDGTFVRWEWTPAPGWNGVGVWMNAGVLPEGLCAVAVEPTNAPFETLTEACAQGRARPIPPYESLHWTIRLTVGRR